jgi:cytochrome c556
VANHQGHLRYLSWRIAGATVADGAGSYVDVSTLKGTSAVSLKTIALELMAAELIALRAQIADMATRIGATLTTIAASAAQTQIDIQLIKEGQTMTGHTLQEIKDDLDTIKTQTGAYIAARDAIDADLRQQIAALTAASGQIPQAVQDDIDAAFSKAEDAKAAIPQPPVNPPPDDPPPADA